MNEDHSAIEQENSNIDLAGLNFESPDLEPSPEVPSKVIGIHLINPEEMSNYCLWVGFFQKGSMQPPDLMDTESILELFEKAASDGLAESAPVMLSDSSTSPKARYIYLLPEPDTGEDPSDWVKQLVSTVKSWSPEKVGLYLAPSLLTKSSSQTLLKKIISELVISTKTTDYFILPGKHGTNSILNTALEIKADLDKENVKIYVFH